MKYLLVLVLVLLALFLSTAGTASADTRYTAVQKAVCHYFTGGTCTQAMSVVRCETGGTFDVWAGYRHHQYWGLFQMGPGERARFGHGWNPWAQARAAKRYFDYEVSIGRWGWDPWSCHP